VTTRLAYALIMMTSVLVAAWLARTRHAKLPITRGERWGIFLGAFVGAMVAARLPFALTDPRGLIGGGAWFGDGKTIVFGLVGGYLGVEAAKAMLGLRLKTGDAFVVPTAAAIAIGRMGCFVAGCCHGRPTDLPWAVDFGDGVLRHPTQLYETVFHVTALACFLVIEARGWLKTQRIKAYILAYLIYRFASESIRPELQVQLGLTVYQWLVLGFVPLFVALWVRDARALGLAAANRTLTSSGGVENQIACEQDGH